MTLKTKRLSTQHSNSLILLFLQPAFSGCCWSVTWNQAESAILAMQPCVCECTYQETTAFYTRFKVLNKTGECPLNRSNILSQSEVWRYKFLVNKALSSKNWNYSEVNTMSNPNNFPSPEKTRIILWTMIPGLISENRFLALHLQNLNESVDKRILRHFCIYRFGINVLGLRKDLIKHPTVSNRNLSLSKVTKYSTCQWLENSQMYQISKK